MVAENEIAETAEPRIEEVSYIKTSLASSRLSIAVLVARLHSFTDLFALAFVALAVAS